MRKIIFLILIISVTSSSIACTNSHMSNHKMFEELKNTAAGDFITDSNDIYPVSVTFICYAENSYNIVRSENDVVISKVLIALSEIQIIGKTTELDPYSFQYFIFTMTDGTNIGFCFNNMHI